MKLFMYIAAADSIYYYNQSMMHFCCRWQLPQLMALSFLQELTPQNIYNALFYLYGAMQFIESFWIFLSMSLNGCLIFDLIIMIKYPFSDKRKFMHTYLLVTILASSLLAVTLEYLDSPWNYIFTVYILLFFFGFYSLIHAYLVLSKPGISAGCRNLIFKRHAASILVFFLSNLYVFAYSAVQTFNIPINE